MPTIFCSSIFELPVGNTETKSNTFSIFLTVSFVFNLQLVGYLPTLQDKLLFFDHNMTTEVFQYKL